MAVDNALTAELAEAALGFDTAALYLSTEGAQSISLLEEALAMIGPAETIERCRLMSRLSSTLRITGSFERAEEVGSQASVLARRIGDGPALLDTLMCELMQIGARPLAASAFAARRRTLEELQQVAEGVTSLHLVGSASSRSLAAYLEIGDVERFQDALARCRKINAQDRDLVLTWIEVGAEAMAALLVGDFALAERKAKAALEMADSVNADLASGVYGMQMFTIRREQGRLGEVAPLIKQFVDQHPEDATWRPGLMLIASDLGFEAQARRNLARMAEDNFALPADSKQLVTLSYLAEVAARVGDEAEAEALYTRLAPFADQAIVVPSFTLCCGSTARYLGLLANRLGDFRRAAAHFERALAMNEAMSAWPWLAHTRSDYAQMLARRGRRGDLARAMRLTSDALATARELGMSALIQRIGHAANVRLVN